MILQFLKTCIGIVIFLSFLYINIVYIDPDLGWHIRVGEWIFENRSVPHTDIYSYTMPGHAWVDHEWLVDVWFWWMHAQGLWWLVAGIFTAMACVPFFVWLWRSRSALDVWAVLLAAVFMAHLIGVRPQVISFFFFFLVFELLSQRYAARGTGSFHYIIFLPMLFLVWANIHAGFVAGFAMWGIYALAYYLWRWWIDARMEYANIVQDTSVVLMSSSVAFLNPYGFSLPKEIFYAATSHETLRYISEWQSALRADILSFQLFLGIVIALVLLFQSYKKMYPPLLTLCLSTALLAVTSVRHAPFFFVAVMPLIFQGTKLVQREILVARTATPFRRGELLFFIVASILLFVFSIGVLGHVAYMRRIPYPDGAIQYLRAEAGRGTLPNIFNAYRWGGYLTWKALEIPVFIDGRMPHWRSETGESAMEEYIEILYSTDNNAWREIFKEREIGIVFIENTPALTVAQKHIHARLLKYTTLEKLLSKLVSPGAYNLRAALLREGWRIAYEDEISVVLRK